MTDVELPFAQEEYGERLAKVRAAMDERGLDVLIVSDPSNMAWLTGYDGWSFYTHQAVVMPLDEAPMWWGRGFDVPGARRTTNLEGDRIIGYPDYYVQSSDLHPHQHLAALLRERGWDRGRVGVELDNYYYSAAAHQALSDGLHDAELADATALVNWQRAIKSPQELAYMRIAARIVEQIHRRVIEIVRPGMRKNDLVAEIYHAAITGADGHGGDYPAIVPLLPTGIDASAPHLTWNDRPIQTGVATYFELAGCYRRYHAPLCRTVFLGTPPTEMVNASSALVEGLAAGVDAARAGNEAREVANALNRELERAGIVREGRCGYAIGLSYPPDWGERTISLRDNDHTVLAPGMTFHFMPGLWMDSWGIEITESILITEEGPAEVLASVPQELVIID